ncbi:laccase domain-containing protein [Candidatus Poriferisodalis sp.]|uniref:laccase domain-containing protein n=1 Tax=Candidatus Poriferisodalis sp. TaxID=3101277 RepID=UPI003B02B949
MLVLRRRCGNQLVAVAVTERSDGDQAHIELDAPASVTALRQVHGTRVVQVTRPGEHRGAEADAAWTSMSGATLAVRTADCVPIALYGTDPFGRSAVAAIHAGWRGLVDGVVRATIAELRHHGFCNVRAVIGPYVCALHYEFGEALLEAAGQAVDAPVASTTHWGAPALDLGAAARWLLRRDGVLLDSEIGRCTAADLRYFSHRARAEQQRTAVLVRIDDIAPRSHGR